MGNTFCLIDILFMASKCFATSGLAISAIVFIVSLIFMILTTTRSATKETSVTTEETVIDYTDVETRSAFNQTDSQNMTTLVLSSA